MDTSVDYLETRKGGKRDGLLGEREGSRDQGLRGNDGCKDAEHEDWPK